MQRVVETSRIELESKGKKLPLRKKFNLCTQLIIYLFIGSARVNHIFIFNFVFAYFA